jgi:hypothetical protein
LRADLGSSLWRKIRRSLWAAALLLAGTRGLAAQDARLAARLPAPTATAVQALVDSAERSGLPGEPLVQKALEGESKGADEVHIVAAVRALLGRLAAGREVLGQKSSAEELIAAAAALRAGAAPATLDSLRALRRDRPLVVPLSVLADLLTVGVPADQAWNSVREMATEGAPDKAFIALRDRYGADAGAARPLPPSEEHPPSTPIPARP